MCAAAALMVKSITGLRLLEEEGEEAGRIKEEGKRLLRNKETKE